MFGIILFYFVGFSQEKNGFSLFSTHEQKNKCIQNSINIFLENECLKNVEKNLIISLLSRDDEVLIRITPLNNDSNKYD